VAALTAAPASAAEVAETHYIFNTLSLFHARLPGYVDGSGLHHVGIGAGVLQKTVAICLENLAVYSIAGLMYYLGRRQHRV